MDVHCTTCGEPWDTSHLRHDAIAETSLDEAGIKQWETLPPEEKLSRRYRDELKAASYEFGQTLMNLTRCPACPPDAKPDAATLYMKAEIEAMLAGDEDGLAAHYEDLHL